MRAPAAAAAAAPGSQRHASSDAPQPAAALASGPIVLQYERLVPCRLLKRYKRFLGDVQLGSAEDAAALPGATAAAEAAAIEAAATEDAIAAVAQSEAPTDAASVVHVPNTGSMAGLLSTLPAAALLSVSADPKRKYSHTLEFIQVQGGTWVGVHSAKANAMVRTVLQAQALPGLMPYNRIQQEVRFGADGKSRVDFVLHLEPQCGTSSTAEGGTSISAAAATGSASRDDLPRKRQRGGKAGAAATAAEAAAASTSAAVGVAAAVAAKPSCCYLEVKACTLAEDRTDGGGRIALFPDAISERAQRHVRELAAIARAGAEAALVFVVLRNDCCAWAPCHERDPAYGRLVREAAAAGVRLLAVVCALDEPASAVRFRGTLPVDLDYKWRD